MPPEPSTLVIIEDSPTEAALIRSYLDTGDYRIFHAPTGQAGLRLIEREKPLAVLLDINLPDKSGIEVLHKIGQNNIKTSVVMVTAEARPESVVQAMRMGAFDYLVKPYNAERMRVTVNNAVDRQRLTRLVDSYRAPFEKGLHGIIGTSPVMQAVYRIIESAAASSATIFITGESGTGKDLCAQAIHAESPRAKGPFVPINCAAIPRDLMESEIFGHVKGAFTGATADRKGAAEEADGGTLFLDEVCDLDLDLQAKLLRFIQTGTYQRVGETKMHRTNIRFICATNRDPLSLVEMGQFREDLYYRLHVIPIELPPLATRGDDILAIASTFLATITNEEGKSFTGFSEDAKSLLLSHEWPGNIRELENTMRNAIVLHDGELLEAGMFAINSGPKNGHGAIPRIGNSRGFLSGTFPNRTLAEIERNAIEAAIITCNGNITEAARMLDINPSTIHRKRQVWRENYPDPEGAPAQGS